jgi:radical SAM protein with 4Fe4S-binding SPASM domain
MIWSRSKVDKRYRQQSFVFEVTSRCNHRCVHCYNAWHSPFGVEEPGQLPTAETLEMLDAMCDQTAAPLVTLSGGEPMLRPDIFEIADHLRERDKRINLISNGSLLTEDAISRFGDAIQIYELPLLCVDRKVHDAISGREGAFDDVTMAMANLKLARQRVVAVFVATSRNLPQWKQTAELAIAMGADGIMFNRFNPGGLGAAQVAELQATPEQLTDALDTAQELADRYRISISCSIAMPPCLFDHSRWPALGFGFCAAGTSRAYYTMDPVGNVRPCNHSATVLGNIREQTFAEMVDSQVMADFREARPAFCEGCEHERTCQGGCKAAAEVCCGDVWACDPFLAAFKDQAAPVR